MSSPQGLEATFGWAHVVVVAEFDTLGKMWEVQKNIFKPFLCVIRVINPTIDASIQLRTKFQGMGLKFTYIARVHPEILVLTGKMDPQTA